MAASVQNVKVVFIRQKGYHDLRAWMADPNNVYVGRSGVVFVKEADGTQRRWPPQESVWCNPFKVGRDGSREEVLDQFETLLATRLEASPALRDELIKLEGKHLGCWCKPEGCHGDVLTKAISAEAVRRAS